MRDEREVADARFGLIHALEELYMQLRFVDADGVGVPLHEACEHGERCWGSCPAACRPDAATVASHGVLPWVGRHYRETGLLVLGLNMNEHGGVNAYYADVPFAQRELHRRNRIRLGNPRSAYSGTLFSVRLLLYAWACLRALGAGPWTDVTDEQLLAVREDVGHASRSLYVDGYDWLAVANVVKCSPRAGADTPQLRECPERGRPFAEMLDSCPSHVLAPELALLRPRLVLALGDDAKAAAESVCSDGAVVVGAPHPSVYRQDAELLRGLTDSLTQLPADRA